MNIAPPGIKTLFAVWGVLWTVLQTSFCNGGLRENYFGGGNDFFFAAIPRMTTAQNPGLFTTFMKLTETQ